MPRISRKRLRLFAQHLRALKRPLVQDADLAVCFFLALRDAGDQAELETVEPEALRRSFRNFRKTLVEFGGIERFPATGTLHGYLVGMAGVPEPEKAICSLDPFSYLSHLTAMVWHGLSDRLPKTIFLTRPSPSLWRTLAASKLESQLGDMGPWYRAAKLPAYRPIDMGAIKKRPLHFWNSSRLDQAYSAAFKRVDDGAIRIATVARCFLDMVREPDLCGGIDHVMEIFEEHGPKHLEAIVNEIDHHGNKIEQARAGYLLEAADASLAANPKLQKWAGEVVRGGSRKLDPSADYADTYSERWALSINV